MQLGVSEILDKINREPNYETRRTMLAACQRNMGVMKMLELVYHPGAKFNLPEGAPPYKPCQFADQQAMLYNGLRTMYLFIGEGNPAVPQLKREALFVGFLESLDPDDAKLVLAVKEKTIPYKNITEELVRSVFPNMLPPKADSSTTTTAEPDKKRRGRPAKAKVNG